MTDCEGGLFDLLCNPGEKEDDNDSSCPACIPHNAQHPQKEIKGLVLACKPSSWSKEQDMCAAHQAMTCSTPD